MELKQAVEGSDVSDIRAKSEALETASRSLADSIARAGVCTSHLAGVNGGSADDEVVRTPTSRSSTRKRPKS